MKILKTRTAPRYVRPEGITSYLLVSTRTCGAGNLTATVVELAPGGSQRLHTHIPEQTYFILAGKGVMTVGNETAEIAEGDCVFVPSDAPHGLRNTGEHPLRYFSAASPSFSAEELDALWPLPPETPQP